MRSWIIALCVPLGLAGCSKILGIEDLEGPAARDAAIDGDPGPPGDAAVTGQVTIRGTVHSGLPGEPAVVTTVELIRPDDTIAAITTSDQAGVFVLTVGFAGAAVDVAVHAKGDLLTGIVDEYMYFSAPLAVDRDVTFQLPTQGDLQDLGLVFEAPVTMDTSFLDVFVEDAGGAPVAGATVMTDQPSAIVRYLDASGQPDPTANTTSVGGTAVVLSQTPDPMQLVAAGAITAGPRLVRLVGGAVFLVELRP